MKFAFFIILFMGLNVSGQSKPEAEEDSPVAVVESKWFRDRRPVLAKESVTAVPARQMIPENKKFQREVRERLSPGAIDPNTQTEDGRSEALEKIVSESRKSEQKMTDGYIYQAKLRNNTETSTRVIFLEFQFTETADPTNTVRRQFLCAVSIKPKEKGDIWSFSVLGPSEVVNVGSLSSSDGKQFESKVMINRIEFSNGSILQRKDWDYRAMKRSIDRATETPWGNEICRGI